MGEASRDESTAIAQRLAAVGELYARRAVEWAERSLWSADPLDAVAAEVSAAQNISHARAVGQVHYARTLRARLPALATVFATGVIDFRMVLTIIARTDNVDDEVMAALDEALARHAEKWMKLSKPKLRDRIDLWVAKFDPPGCASRPRSTTTAMSRWARPARGWPGSGPTCTPPTPRHWTIGWTRWPPPCVRTTRAPQRSAAPMPPGRALSRRASQAHTINCIW